MKGTVWIMQQEWWFLDFSAKNKCHWRVWVKSGSKGVFTQVGGQLQAVWCLRDHLRRERLEPRDPIGSEWEPGELAKENWGESGKAGKRAWSNLKGTKQTPCDCWASRNQQKTDLNHELPQAKSQGTLVVTHAWPSGLPGQPKEAPLRSWWLFVPRHSRTPNHKTFQEWPGAYPPLMDKSQTKRLVPSPALRCLSLGHLWMGSAFWFGLPTLDSLEFSWISPPLETKGRDKKGLGF